MGTWNVKGINKIGKREKEVDVFRKGETWVACLRIEEDDRYGSFNELCGVDESVLDYCGSNSTLQELRIKFHCSNNQPILCTTGFKYIYIFWMSSFIDNF